MPHVERIVVAGMVREVRKMYTGRVHTKGVKRGKNVGSTSQAQEKVNERKIEELLRWILNANFSVGDYHIVLHYYDNPREQEQAEKDKQEFLRLLRIWCRKQGVPWKYVACTESRWASRFHHHIILPPISPAVLFEIWEQAIGRNGGNVSIKPMDRRGNHAKLARYLIKETRETARLYREAGKRYKRFSRAQGMITPEPEYRIVNAAKWTDDPKPKKNYTLLKDDDGNTVRSGIHEVSGWPWQEYFELWTGEGKPPGQTRRRKQNGRMTS